MESKRIHKKKHFIVPEREPFTCEHCCKEVLGGGTVNHCPSCLWSKHVDLCIPGDRASDCGGMMKPVGVEQKHGKWRIRHKCLECDIERINDASPDNNFDEIIRLSTKSSRN